MNRTARIAARLPIIAFLMLAGCSSEGGETSAVTPGADAGDGGSGGGARFLAGPSHGSTIDVSVDDSRVVVVNRDVGTLSVFETDLAAAELPALKKVAEIAVGGEPSSVVLAPNGDTAFVAVRKDRKVVRVDGLRSEPKKGPEVLVGSEPTSIAMTPAGTSVWVASWAEGTVQEIATQDMTIKSTVDLNATLAASGMLGPGLTARPALAHPRSVAITNNNDSTETDETLYVTEYFAQQKEALAADGSNADKARVGIVYKIPLASKQATMIELPPMADMGFRDHNDGVAGCYPNQLQTIQIQGAFAYVPSICASPKGPVGVFTGPPAATCNGDAACPGAVPGSCVNSKCTTNCTANEQCGKNGGVCSNNVCKANFADVKTTLGSAVTILDLGAGKTIATVNLNAEWNKFYDAKGTADTAARRLPATAMDIAFVPGTVTAYVAAHGADALFRVDFNATYEASTIDSVGDGNKGFIELGLAGVDPSKIGRLPIGVAVAHKLHKGKDGPRYGFVANEATRNVSVVDLMAAEVAGASTGTPVVTSSSPMPTDAREQMALEGKRMFFTGLGRWSLNSQGWGACGSCHTDGLTDNVTWFFPRGIRQSPSLDGLFASKDPTDAKLQNWTAIQDEIADHEMGAVRGTLGGIGAIVKDASLSYDNRIAIDKLGHAGLAGSSMAAANPSNPGGLAPACVLDDWQKVLAYVQGIRSPRRPAGLDAAKVAQGKQLFNEAGCQGCHGGAKWTISRVFYTPDATGTLNKALIGKSWSQAVQSSEFPTALLPTSVAASQTMRYSGANAAAMDQMTCILRNVGTFNVAEPGVGIAELRQNMTTPAQGDEADGRGYNPPSLLNAVVGAPFLHAGNARTLEALLSSTFASHHGALAPGFLGSTDSQAAAKREALVQFLLSIDEDQDPIAIPPLGKGGGSFCAVP